MLRRIVFQRRAPNQLIDGELEHLFCRIAADIVQLLERLGRESIGELIDLDVFFVGRDFTVDIDLVAA